MFDAVCLSSPPLTQDIPTHAYFISDLPTQPSTHETQRASNHARQAPYRWQRIAARGALIVSFLGSIAFGFQLDISRIYPPPRLSITPVQAPDKHLFTGRACEGASIVDIWTTASHLSLAGAHEGAHPASLLTNNEAPSWCFSGSKGQVGVLLQSPSVLAAIHIRVKREPSLFHLPWTYVATAPCEILVWGLIDGDKSRREIERIEGLPDATQLFKDTSHLFMPIARLEYDGRITAPDVQRVATNSLLSRSTVRFGLVIVEIRSNWGGGSVCLDGITIFEVGNV